MTRAASAIARPSSTASCSDGRQLNDSQARVWWWWWWWRLEVDLVAPLLNIAGALQGCYKVVRKGPTTADGWWSRCFRFALRFGDGRVLKLAIGTIGHVEVVSSNRAFTFFAPPSGRLQDSVRTIISPSTVCECNTDRMRQEAAL